MGKSSQHSISGVLRKDKTPGDGTVGAMSCTIKNVLGLCPTTERWGTLLANEDL